MDPRPPSSGKSLLPLDFHKSVTNRKVLMPTTCLIFLLRATVFIALGASGFAPILHATLSPKLSLEGFSLEYVLAQSAFYLLGTAFYVNRFPEKYWKGIFDVWVRSSSSLSPVPTSNIWGFTNRGEHMYRAQVIRFFTCLST